jgi:hypothetical protein
VVVQSDLAAQAGAALGAVDMVTKRIANAIGEMNETATRQASAGEMISQSMTDIAEITAQTRDSMEQMRGSMDRLVELAQSLLGSISVFRLGENGRTYLPVLLPAATDPTAMADKETEPVPAVGEVADGGWTRRAGSFSAVSKGGVTTQLPRSSYPVHPPVMPDASSGPAEAQQGTALGQPAPATSGPLAGLPPAARPPITSRSRGDTSSLPPLDRHPGS